MSKKKKLIAGGDLSIASFASNENISSSENKPSWLPSRCWQEYLELVRNTEAFRKIERTFAYDGLAEQQLSFYKKLIFHEDCELVWKAIERRRPAAQGKFSKEWARGGSIAVELSLYNALLQTCFELSCGPRRVEQTSATVRKSHGAKIALLACSLRDEIDSALKLSGDQWPREFVDSIRNASESLSVDYKEAHDKLRSQIVTISDLSQGNVHVRRVPRSKISRTYETSFPADLIERAFRHAIFSYDQVLRAIIDGAERWAESKPPLTKLNARNAARTYFVMGITDFFMDSFDMPLREQTAALARVIFDCEMSASEVIRLAPVD